MMKLLQFLHRIPTHYDERKATAAASYLIVAGNGRIKFIRLIKLLYMADRESWERYGRPITGDRYVAMEHGPVLSQTYDLIKAEGEQEEPSGVWQRTIQRVSSHDVRLQGEADYGPLSEAEIEILDEVHQRYRSVDTWKLIEDLHELPEWKERAPKPGKSNEYGPEEILKAVGKEDSIRAVRADMEALEEFQKSLGVF